MAVKNETVWLLVIDDHREAMNYCICDSIETARKLFEETVRENYFDGTSEEEKELKKQLENDAGGEWLYANDFVNFYEYDIMSMKDLNKVELVKGKTSKAIAEFQGMCGKKVAIDLSHIEYIQDDKMMGKPCTLICFTSGKKLFVDAEYASVRDALIAFKMDTCKEIELI